MVNSFMPAHCLAQDRTVYATFISQGNEKESIVEFARGRAWRAQQQLGAFIDHVPYTEDSRLLAEYLSKVAAELQMTVELLAQKKSDEMKFYDENASNSQHGYSKSNEVESKQ